MLFHDITVNSYISYSFNILHALESENSVSWHGKIVLALSRMGPLFQFRLELVWTAGGCQFGEKNKKKADDVHLRPIKKIKKKKKKI